MKNVLVLGGGLVAPPLVRHLLSQRQFRLIIASREFGSVAAVVEGNPRAHMLPFDVADAALLDRLVAECDVAVSLLPVEHLPLVIRAAIRHRKDLVNTSYRTPAVRALEAEVAAAGIAVISEVGLDPGIDHMSACRVLRRLRGRGARIEQFSSCCGGFPARDANDNPWGYKFSWSPRAVILAARNAARYRAGGTVIDIPGPELFRHVWPYEITDHGMFEVYPNRDALAYDEPYGLCDVPNVFRGTLRHPGWCATFDAAARLGLFELEPVDWPAGATFADLTLRFVPRSDDPLASRVAAFIGTSSDSEVITRLEWAGLLSDRPLETRRAAPLDLFVARLQRLMMYRPGERDMVALQHTIVASFPDGRVETLRSSLVRAGTPWGDSAMAQTVSLPAAIAARLLLDRRRLPVTGIGIPTVPEIYEPVLDELESLGIAMKETTSTHYPAPFDPI